MTTHLWVIEVKAVTGWEFIDTGETRAKARYLQKTAYDRIKTRIRKYVPA
ncbi:hypothetical protein LMG26685_02922 [Achromobacter mucicolens]|nr:hypothetical protein LMG26685_02922 [Achromobacter mucicolens]